MRQRENKMEKTLIYLQFISLFDCCDVCIKDYHFKLIDVGIKAAIKAATL